MLPTLQRVAGARRLMLVPKVTGSEDFSFFQRVVPGLFFFVGVTPEPVPTRRKAAPNHSPRFFVDERACCWACARWRTWPATTWSAKARPHLLHRRARRMDRQTSKVSAVGYRIACKPHAGRKVLTLRGAMQREAAAPQPCPLTSTATTKHAAVRVEARDRNRLEQLSRCITRPALSHERVRLNAAGQVELNLKTPWRYGPRTWRCRR